MAPEEFRVPAIVAFPEKASVAVEFRGDEGRDRATEAMQALMLRFLTGLPAGKARFTIIDPVGLGRGFAGFMHLADYSEAMVGGRIWTEPQQIEARLADLNLHIETVIQSYLRNEYPTIEAYNQTAGEVAEPYRVLVVADFPAGFSEASARRAGGDRPIRPPLRGLSDPGRGRRPAQNPQHGGGGLRRRRDADRLARRPIFAQGPRLRTLPLRDRRPAAPRGVHQTPAPRRRGCPRRQPGWKSPSRSSPPRPEDYWKGDTALGLSVPLGRAGATKLQSLALGKGTSQHVLTAGRTGSGKSTLLHALITNAALIYSPDQIEMYLIDFKKGVEFKTYATQGLPHARVVAIESEREFGLSVLQRLDAELKVRGDRFRDLGVQDLAGYRRQTDQPPLPRVMLIVDEFQEFFIEDDKLAQEASLLFDRLVRQGRAFGIHVVLGSQTLSGAYSLARSTLGQMAVRIALQCSEADAQLILNEDNSAARLLSRPGEAIYNDANGPERRQPPFSGRLATGPGPRAVPQDDHRVDPRARPHAPPPDRLRGEPAFGFLQAPGDDRPPAGVDRPASALPQGVAGGGRGDQRPHRRLVSPPGRKPLAGRWSERRDGDWLAVVGGAGAGRAAGLRCQDRRPGRHARGFGLGGPVREARPGGPPAVPGGRAAPGGGGPRGACRGDRAPPGRWGVRAAVPADLRLTPVPRPPQAGRRLQLLAPRQGRAGQPGEAARHAALREGPPLGLHTIVWCDSLNNANRAFDRQALREFEMRVLFQMSAADSSNLIDSPAANRLGPNRALFASEEQGVLEKFRPYGPPTEPWIDELRQQWEVGPVGELQ